MMVRKCNRCKVPIPSEMKKGSIEIVGMKFMLHDFRGHFCTNDYYRDLDLCDVCARDFLEWIAIDPHITKPREEGEE